MIYIFNIILEENITMRLKSNMYVSNLHCSRTIAQNQHTRLNIFGTKWNPSRFKISLFKELLCSKKNVQILKSGHFFYFSVLEQSQKVQTSNSQTCPLKSRLNSNFRQNFEFLCSTKKSWFSDSSNIDFVEKQPKSAVQIYFNF